MTSQEQLTQAKADLEDLRQRIEAFSWGDRPSSPPVSLLREEARLENLVKWYEAVERDRIAAEKAS